MRRDAGMFDVSHMTVVDLSRRAHARVPASSAREQRRQAQGLGQGALLVHARRAAAASSTISSSISSPRIFSASSSMPRRARRISPGSRSRPSRSACRVTERADLSMIAVQGPNAREKVLGLLSAENARQGRQARQVRRGRRRRTGFKLFIARTGYTGEDGFEIIVPEGEAVALWNRLKDRGRRAGRPRRARYAAPRSRHESLRPGHGRRHHAVGGRARLDRLARRRPRLHRPQARSRSRRPRASSACWSASSWTTRACSGTASAS